MYIIIVIVNDHNTISPIATYTVAIVVILHCKCALLSAQVLKTVLDVSIENCA